MCSVLLNKSDFTVLPQFTSKYLFCWHILFQFIQMKRFIYMAVIGQAMLPKLCCVEAKCAKMSPTFIFGSTLCPNEVKSFWFSWKRWPIINHHIGMWHVYSVAILVINCSIKYQICSFWILCG